MLMLKHELLLPSNKEKKIEEKKKHELLSQKKGEKEHDAVLHTVESIPI